MCFSGFLASCITEEDRRPKTTTTTTKIRSRSAAAAAAAAVVATRRRSRTVNNMMEAIVKILIFFINPHTHRERHREFVFHRRCRGPPVRPSEHKILICIYKHMYYIYSDHAAYIKAIAEQHQHPKHIFRFLNTNSVTPFLPAVQKSSAASSRSRLRLLCF